MIWLSWRQLRAPALPIYAAGAVLAVALLLTGLSVADLADETGGSFFAALHGSGSDTAAVRAGLVAVLFLPAVIGAFWGAPLVARELETGTHRLVWSQSVTRTRWLLTRVGLAGVAAAVVTALLGLVVAWWFKPIDAAVLAGTNEEGGLASPRMEPLMFVARGIAPIGYALFALALGVAVGALVRRVVPAMAITLVLFAAVQVAVPSLVRAHLSPATLTATITEENLRGLAVAFDPRSGIRGPVEGITIAVDEPGAWVVANETVDASGEAVAELPSWVTGCAGPPPTPGAEPKRQSPADRQPCFDRLAAEGFRQKVTYQPASRFWTLQAVETGGFLVLAGLLTGLALWRVRRLA